MGGSTAPAFQAEEKSSFPEGEEVEEGGFLSMLYLPGSCCWESLEMQGIVGQVGSPHCTLWPQFVGVCICVNMRLSLCTCVSACLLCGFLYLFVILDTGWLGLLGWLVGSWEGLSCWRFQIEPVSGRAQLLETVTFLLEI